jgi:electron transfer flavoprotein beta subunit
VERALMNGLETYEAEMPALISVSNEFGQARIPTGRGIIFAAKKPIPLWEGASLGVDPSVVGEQAVRNKMIKLYVPLYERKCEMITGESVAEAAAALAEKIIAIK